MLGIITVSTLIGITSNLPFFEWVWQRHHNPMSWHIRPWLLVIFAYFSYRQHITGTIVTLISGLTSIYWFPENAAPSSEVLTLLSLEHNFIHGGWSFLKVASLLGAASFIGLLGYAFWKRFFALGLIATDGIILAKIIWNTFQFQGYAFSNTFWSLAALVIINVLLTYVYHKLDTKRLLGRIKYPINNHITINHQAGKIYR